MILTSMFSSLALFYTDPGTGTMILQLLAAAVLGVAFYFRYFTKRVKGYFSRKKEQGNVLASSSTSGPQSPTTSSDLSDKVE